MGLRGHGAGRARPHLFNRMAGGTESPGRLTGFGWRTGNGTRRGGTGNRRTGFGRRTGTGTRRGGTGNRRTGSGRRTSDHTMCKLTWPNSVTPPVLLKNPDLLFSSPSGPGTPPVLQPNPVLLFFPPAPPPPCRGLTPHRSLKWPAREGGFRLAASRRPLRGRLHPSSRAGLAFGAHQAKPSAEARFTGLTETAIPPTNHKKVFV